MQTTWASLSGNRHLIAAFFTISGGANGGYLALASDAFLLLPRPGPFSLLGVDGLQAMGTGIVVGLLPGGLAHLGTYDLRNRRLAQLAVFGASATAAAIVVGFLAVLLGAGAYV